MVAVVQYFTERQSKAWHRQKLYADTYDSNLKREVGQILGQIRSLVELWKLDKPQIPVVSETNTPERGRNRNGMDCHDDGALCNRIGEIRCYKI